MSDKPVAAGKSSFDLIDKEKMFAIIDVKPDSNFLDLACGVGRYSIEIAKNIGEKGKVYAIDLWKEGIEALNREIDIRMEEKDIEALVAQYGFIKVAGSEVGEFNYLLKYKKIT